MARRLEFLIRVEHFEVNPWSGSLRCAWARHFILILPLFAQRWTRILFMNLNGNRNKLRPDWPISLNEVFVFLKRILLNSYSLWNKYLFNFRNVIGQSRVSIQTIQVTTLEFTERPKFTDRALEIKPSWGFLLG